MPAEVYPNIYIGSIHAAFNQEALIERGITHVMPTYKCRLILILVYLDIKRFAASINFSENIYISCHRR